MEFTSRVLYDEDFTYYNVLKINDEKFKARLLDGYIAPCLPKEILLEKQGDRWIGEADETVLHYLNFDINKKLELRDR